MRVLSLGAGVQSTTLLLMAIHGEADPLDVAVFADTQWEPQAVYQHLDWLEARAAEAGIPVYRVSTGNLRDDALAGKPEAWMPLFAIGSDGASVMLRRQCTERYKLRAIRRQTRALMQERGETSVEQWIGISLDEAVRMKPSGVAYVTNRWPLIERRMTRLDCLNWLERHGYPRPPKSSCIGCPFHDRGYWRRLRDESPDDWADAVAFDRAIRGARMADPVYLHASCRPLDQVDLSTPEDHGQRSLWDAECEGMCGV